MFVSKKILANKTLIFVTNNFILMKMIWWMRNKSWLSATLHHFTVFIHGSGLEVLDKRVSYTFKTWTGEIWFVAVQKQREEIEKKDLGENAASKWSCKHLKQNWMISMLPCCKTTEKFCTFVAKDSRLLECKQWSHTGLHRWRKEVNDWCADCH